MVTRLRTVVTLMGFSAFFLSSLLSPSHQKPLLLFHFGEEREREREREMTFLLYWLEKYCHDRGKITVSYSLEIFVNALVFPYTCFYYTRNYESNRSYTCAHTD